MYQIGLKLILLRYYYRYRVLFCCYEFVNSASELTNNETSSVLCSVVKHAGSGRARKKRKNHETQSSVLLYFLSALPLFKGA